MVYFNHHALVVQRIGRDFAEVVMQVRFLPRAHIAKDIPVLLWMSFAIHRFSGRNRTVGLTFTQSGATT